MKKIFTSIICAAAVLVSCNEPVLHTRGNGGFAVNVDEITDQYVTKSGDILDHTTFDYQIIDEYGEVYMEGKVGDMPEVFENVPTGDYTIEVSSPGNKPAAFDQPIIAGSAQFTVKPSEITSVVVNCSIQNVKVSIIPDQAFFDELATYTITISNGNNADNKLIWTNETLEGANYAELTQENAGAAKCGYFTVTSGLNIYVTGYRANNGATATYEGIISPIEAKDHFIVKLYAKKTGQVQGITLTVDYTTVEKNEDVRIPGFEDVPVDGPDDPSTGDGNEGGGNEGGGETELVGLSLEWPANPDYGMYELKSAYSDTEVTLTVMTENFIEGFIVKITSPTVDFLNTVKEIAGSTVEGEYVVLDLMKPETAEAMAFLPTGDALRDQSQVDFPLSGLLPLIVAFGPEQGSVHTFIMEVTDMKGQVLTKELQFEYRGN